MLKKFSHMYKNFYVSLDFNEHFNPQRSKYLKVDLFKKN